MINVCTKNLALQIDRGNLRNCLKTFASSMLTMEQGNLRNQAQAHIVKEQFVPTEHRDIASFNADNEFNRAIDEENIDFNFPSVPNSKVKRSRLSYWDVGIVYCTCGHFLRDDTTENKKYISSVLDLFTIPNFYIRKGRPHSHRYGKKVIKNTTLQINSRRSVRNDNS